MMNRRGDGSINERLFMTCVKIVRQTLLSTVMIGERTTVMGFFSKGERWGSIQNTKKNNMDL